MTGLALSAQEAPPEGVAAPPAETAALAIAGVSHKLGGRDVLCDIDLTVPAGRFVVLLGQNGAGKTTLFSLVTRLYTSRPGTTRVFGQDLPTHPGRALTLLGSVLQERSVDLQLTTPAERR